MDAISDRADGVTMGGLQGHSGSCQKDSGGQRRAAWQVLEERDFITL